MPFQSHALLKVNTEVFNVLSYPTMASIMPIANNTVLDHHCLFFVRHNINDIATKNANWIGVL